MVKLNWVTLLFHGELFTIPIEHGDIYIYVHSYVNVYLGNPRNIVQYLGQKTGGRPQNRPWGAFDQPGCQKD